MDESPVTHMGIGKIRNLMVRWNDDRDASTLNTSATLDKVTCEMSQAQLFLERERVFLDSAFMFRS